VSGPSTLVLVPTERERQHLAAQPGFAVDAPCELCGFGPVAAAAHTATVIARHRPDRVVLLGIAGTYDTVALPVESAAVFGSVTMHGVGVGAGAGFISAAALGFHHWREDQHPPPDVDELSLSIPVAAAVGPLLASTLLTCCTASADTAEANLRRRQHPNVTAEDMEGYGVALACRLAEVPLAIARGISNEVGDRGVTRWRIREALDAAWIIASDLIRTPTWSTRP
jgi:futalosine hydrolase